MYDEVVNTYLVVTYAESLFLGHCTAADLVTLFYEVVQPLGLKGVNLLHLGVWMVLELTQNLKNNCRVCFMSKRTNQSCL